MGIGPNEYWTKWTLDQMTLDQKDIRPNGIRRNGNKPFEMVVTTFSNFREFCTDFS